SKPLTFSESSASLGAMPKFWMISNRALSDNLPGSKRGPLTYWISERGPLDTFSNWKKVSKARFKTMLGDAADAFPPLDHAHNEDQKHVTFFIHGYNNGWADAAQR